MFVKLSKVISTTFVLADRSSWPSICRAFIVSL